MLASGREHRNGRWADSRRRCDAGFGIRGLDALHAVLAFFEERRGRLYGFRFRDRVDHRSYPPSQAVSPTEQGIGLGDGERRAFSLAKTYGEDPNPYRRAIRKPRAGSMRMAIDGDEVPAARFDVDPATELVTLAAVAKPAAVARVSAGLEFDVPVRFDTDDLAVDFAAFTAGKIPHVPLIEIVP